MRNAIKAFHRSLGFSGSCKPPLSFAISAVFLAVFLAGAARLNLQSRKALPGWHSSWQGLLHQHHFIVENWDIWGTTQELHANKE